jgi:DNA-binding NtrC family response regulator
MLSLVPANQSMERRVLILAPFGRDADVISELLTRDGRSCVQCANAHALTAELGNGAATALITEEALAGEQAAALFDWLESQPAWSDFPIILLASNRVSRRSAQSLEVLERLGNVVVLERPLNSETLRRAVTSSLRARVRQYSTIRAGISTSRASILRNASKPRTPWFSSTIRSKAGLQRARTSLRLRTTA